MATTTTITTSGGDFILDGSLAIDVPQNAVAASTSVTTATHANPPSSPGYIVRRTWKVDAPPTTLASLGRLHHPAVDGVDETKLAFYWSPVATGPIPSAAAPMPISPWMDDIVNGQSGYLPPASGPVQPATNTMFVSIVEVP